MMAILENKGSVTSILMEEGSQRKLVKVLASMILLDMLSEERKNLEIMRKKENHQPNKLFFHYSAKAIGDVSVI
ncbi:hypothetical protein G7K71_14310 [Desulfofundulus sp. TPOSR]|uniref:hypothetical protein n=1 Tax=Desulfofundulus sp. TPOSR TaxID=2714340 RepID=UPI00140BBBA7|nr:hypothetical protein [Desulfofundulus sp. TPOSR]NHM28131.1 hypothetical protein [Desulfofundulus sp. TPOSR]